jgi:hypothetical protein
MTPDYDDVEKHPKRVADLDQRFIWVGNKDMKKLQRAAWDAWWWPKRTKSGIIWFAPTGVGQVTVHGTASDHHAYANALSEFRKAGLKI